MRTMLILVLLLGMACSHQVKIVAPTGTESRKTHEAFGPKQMVATQGPATTRAALEIFDQGGNIIDAFVAASFAVSVERPQSTGIGGGGFLVFFRKAENKVYAFDFREVAPLASTQDMFLDSIGNTRPLLSQEGALAVATPGLVKGLYELHKKWGRLPWKVTMAPAIKLAREGFPLYDHLELALRDRKAILALDAEARAIFLTKDKEVPPLGTPVIQENLARTLEVIAEKGSDGFYKGDVAKRIVATVRKRKGILSRRDLERYEMKERAPVVGDYKGLKIFSMPPPSSGGIHVIQILRMLENLELKKLGPQSTEAIHLTAKSMQRAFLDRALYLGDPDYHEVPVRKLLDNKYLGEMSLAINAPRAVRADDLRPVELTKESTETTHFTIADEEGNMVASTQTINGWFGSGVIAKGTGIILNNEMDDFAQKVGALNLFGAVGGRYNLVEPRKRPLSSMSPTILIKGSDAILGLGSPSGTRIISCVAQTILNAIEFEMPLYEAVAATRIHQQWIPDELKVEEPYLDSKVEEALKEKGHKIVHERLGCSVQAIARQKNQWVGVSDPRNVGLAKGR